MVTAGRLHQVREVQAGAGFLSGSTLVQHFGLGAHARIDRLDVAWPSGTHTTVTDIAADQKLMLREDAAAPIAVQRWQLPLARPAAPADVRRTASGTGAPARQFLLTSPSPR
jgi:hypothetical protein